MSNNNSQGQWVRVAMVQPTNSMTFVGNLGQDPELRWTQSGQAVVSLNVATTYSEKVGEKWNNETQWIRFTLWGGTAEAVQKKYRKGQQVCITVDAIEIRACYAEGKVSVEAKSGKFNWLNNGVRNGDGGSFDNTEEPEDLPF